MAFTTVFSAQLNRAIWWAWFANEAHDEIEALRKKLTEEQHTRCILTRIVGGTMHRYLFLALLPGIATAADLEVSHQGRLTDSTGQPYQGQQSITLRLLNHPSDNTTGNELHSESFTAVPLNDGYYAVVLGRDPLNPLDSGDVSGEVWLEITVGSTTLSPRSKLTDVPGAIAAQPPGTTRASAAFSCKVLRDAGVTDSGLYWVNPTGDTPVRTWCDMNTDGGGWTLVSHAYTGSASTSGGANNSHRSLRCGGGNFQPQYRGAGSGAIDAVQLARNSTEIAFGIEIDGETILTGDLTAYDRAYAFSIPNPSSVTFANHSYYAPNWSTVAGPCVPVTLTRIDGGGSYSSTQYTLRNSLGTTWTDTFPTGYGVSDNANCYNHDGDAFVHSIHSGAYRGYATNECDVGGGRGEYSYRGNYVDDAGGGTTAGTGKTGSSTIWLR